MGKELYSNSKSAKELFDKADQILGFSLSKIMFEGTDEDLKEDQGNTTCNICSFYSKTTGV